MNRQERRREARGAEAKTLDLLKTAFGLHQAGDLAAAEHRYREVLRQDRNHPEALRLLGEVLIDRGKVADAIVLFQRLADLQPDNYVLQYSLANAFRIDGRTTAAIDRYQMSLALNPEFAGAHHGLACAYRSLHRDHDAAAGLRLAVKFQPGWALAWKDLGLTLAVLGEMPEAKTALRRALALDPGLADIRRHLAALTQDQDAAEDVRALQKRLSDPRTPAHEHVELLFALGDLAHDAGRFDNAFGYISEANRKLRGAQALRGVRYNRQKMTNDVDALIAHFKAEDFPGRAALGNPSELPVFILGMPRTGSSLVEQIAASHSKVAGNGEQKLIGAIAGRLGWRHTPAWSAANMSHEADGYLNALQSANPGRARAIDKMPDNVFQLGLIATLFPNARVIFCRREPVDTCLSCFFQNFAESSGFDTDLDDCAHRFLETNRLMAHWQTTLPLRMLNLSYEDLVENFEATARGLIEFLGLEWEAGCLDFHLTKRPVRTASWAQVRQPIYRTAVAHRQAYARFLPDSFRQIGWVK